MSEAPVPRARQLWQKGASVMAVQLAGIGVSVLVPVVLARVLGPAGFGVYATVLALVQVLAYLPSLGFDTGVLRYLPSYAATERWGALHGFLRAGGALVACTSLVAGGLLVAVAFALGPRLDPATRGTLAAGGVLLAFLPPLNVLVGAMRALKRPVRAQLLDGVLRPALLATALLGAVLLARVEPSAAAAMTLHGGVACGLAGLGALWLRSALPTGWRGATPHYEVRTWLRTSAPMLATGLMQALVRQMDILYVGLLMTKEHAGLYAVASRLARLVVLGQAASNTIGAPHIAELAEAGRTQELGRIARATCLGAVVAGSAVATVLFIARDPVLGVFGPDFKAAAPVLLILVAGQLINVSAGPVGYLLNLTGHQDALTKLTLGLTVTAAVLMPVGIHFGGIGGAAVVSALVIATRNLVALALVRRHLKVQPSVLGILRHGLR